MDETAVALIVAGADVNAKNNFDATRLHSAVHYRSTDLVAVLAADKNGNTPTSIAATGWNYDHIAKLLQADADMLGSKAWGASQRPVDMDCCYGRAGRSPLADARGR